MYADVCKMIGIKYPIIQGAMAWVSDASLVSAVSNAGGLGVLATGHLDPDGLKNEIAKVKKMTDKPYAVNIFLMSPFVDEFIEIVCTENVPVVTTGAGNPGKYMPRLKESGVKVIPVVASVAIAKKLASIGVDALVAEGMESGGHIGKTTTMALLPQIVDAVSIPVIAAGGIADGRGMAAATMLGASAFQIGTRFLVANECTIHENYKKRIIKANDIDTTVTGQSTGHPVRVIRNRLTRAFDDLEKKGMPQEEFDKIGRGALRKAVTDGDMDYGSVMSGQIAGLVKKEQSAKEIIEEMYTEYTLAMQNAPKLV